MFSSTDDAPLIRAHSLSACGNGPWTRAEPREGLSWGPCSTRPWPAARGKSFGRGFAVAGARAGSSAGPWECVPSFFAATLHRRFLRAARSGQEKAASCGADRKRAHGRGNTWDGPGFQVCSAYVIGVGWTGLVSAAARGPGSPRAGGRAPRSPSSPISSKVDGGMESYFNSSCYDADGTAAISRAHRGYKPNHRGARRIGRYGPVSIKPQGGFRKEGEVSFPEFTAPDPSRGPLRRGGSSSPVRCLGTRGQPGDPRTPLRLSPLPLRRRRGADPPPERRAGRSAAARRAGRRKVTRRPPPRRGRPSRCAAPLRPHPDAQRPGGRRPRAGRASCARSNVRRGSATARTFGSG